MIVQEKGLGAAKHYMHYVVADLSVEDDLSEEAEVLAVG